MIKQIEKIDLLDVTKLTEGDRVIFTVDTGTLPMHKIQEYFDSIIQAARQIIPEPIHISIVPKTIEITIEKS